MNRRSPFIPKFSRMIVQASGTALAGGMASGLWAGSSHGRIDSVRLVSWCLVTVFCSVGLCLPIPLLRRLEPDWDQQETPFWQRWVQFYGLFVAIGAVAGALRNILLHGLIGEPSGPFRLMLEMAQYSGLGAILAFLHDRITFLDREITAESTRIEAEVKRVFLSREVLIEAKKNVDSGVIQALIDRLEPDLDDLDARLQEMIEHVRLGGTPDNKEFDDLMRQVDRLRGHEIRHLSHAIHPSVIDVSLLPAVRMLVRRYHGTFELELTESESLREADLAGQNLIPADVRLNAYRCLEHALENVAKHSRAQRARINLDLCSEVLIGEVSDDGIGFDAANARRGLGLHVIEVRIVDLKGLLEIDSTPGAGTRLRFELPLGT